MNIILRKLRMEQSSGDARSSKGDARGGQFHARLPTFFRMNQSTIMLTILPFERSTFCNSTFCTGTILATKVPGVARGILKTLDKIDFSLLTGHPWVCSKIV